MEELDIAAVTRRSIRGVFALVSRTFIVQLIAILVNFLLTIVLSPSIFGVFFIVSAVIAFFSYFSDIGLAAALIQKKDEITKEELTTAFTIQQILILIIVFLGFIFSSYVGAFYKLDREGIFLFQALIVGFFLSSLKTIPSIILERQLRFDKLVIPQIVETLFFNLTLLFFAVQGYEIRSFTYAVIARGLSGLIAIYIIAPWPIRIGFSKNVAKKLLSFGIPFQTNSILALIKDDLLIIYLGKILPLHQVGYIGFSQKWAFTPLRLIMDNIIRITFPSFSRLQQDKEVLRKALEKTLFAISLFIFPSVAGLIILAPYFVTSIPRYAKWEPALLSLSFFALNALLSSISTPLTNVLNAIGKIKITLYLMVFWTISTWVLTPIAVDVYGFNGVSIAAFFISFSVVGVVILAKKYISFNIFPVIRYPLLSTLIMAAFLYIVSPLIISNIISLLGIVVFGGIIYFGSLMVFAKKELLLDIKLIRENLRS